MNIDQFKELAKEYNLIPVYEIITADLLTPVLAYAKLREKGKQSFLLESVQGSLTMARYSFIGIDPEKVLANKGGKLFEEVNGKFNVHQYSIFNALRDEIKEIKQARLQELPEFTGGLVGFLGYENIGLNEQKLSFDYPAFYKYDSIFGVYKTILAFDHYKHQIILITNVFVDDVKDSENLHSKAKKELNNLKAKLLNNNPTLQNFKLISELNTDFEKASFFKSVLDAKEEITNGEIFQIVLSKRFSASFSGDLLNVYRSLRIINPSPYMYFLEFNEDFSVLGTSPEDLLKVQNKQVKTLPIAGTRRRGRNEQEDQLLQENLLNDPKELAEHTMLVDLGRNDLGRVCKYGSVHVSEMMKIQKYSHVMHIVSKVEGELADDKDSIDALSACFPAGTVTGAPKIRAMELIKEFENEERNVYAGAVGYLDFSGNLDMCIAIRTLFAIESKIFWQAGAGIVADSVPELEAKEIINKAAVMANALKKAEVIDESVSDR